MSRGCGRTVHVAAAKWVLKRAARSLATRAVSEALDVPTPTEFVVGRALELAEEQGVDVDGLLPGETPRRQPREVPSGVDRQARRLLDVAGGRAIVEAVIRIRGGTR